MTPLQLDSTCGAGLVVHHPVSARKVPKGLRKSLGQKVGLPAWTTWGDGVRATRHQRNGTAYLRLFGKKQPKIDPITQLAAPEKLDQWYLVEERQ